MQLSSIEKVDVATRATARMAVDRILLRDGGQWHGMRVEHWQFEPRELREFYMSTHAVALHLRKSPCEVKWGDDRWKREPLEPWTVHFLPAGMPRAVRWTDVNEVLCLTIEPELVSAVTHFRRRAELPPQVIRDPFVGQTLLALAQDLRLGCPEGALYGECLGSALIAHLVCKYGTEKAATVRSSLSSHQLARVLDYIEANLERVVTLTELAELVSMNKFNFMREFSNELGMPPYRYCLMRRLERAKTLLRDGALPLSEVALRTGFSSHSHFASAFRNYAGLSPKAYRNVTHAEVRRA